MAKDYALGRGELHFAKYNVETGKYSGYRYLGNTPEFNINVETESLDHFNMDHGVGEKDASVITSSNRTGSIIADEITGPNLALFLFGESSTVAVSAMSATVAEEIPNVELDRSYPLGVTENDGIGVLRAIYPGTGATAFTVTNAAGSTTYVHGTDYLFDQRSAMIKTLKAGSIVAGSTIKVNYAEAAYTFESIVSGAEPTQGAIKYISDNAYGKDHDWYLPLVSVRPSGDFALKAEADWQAMPFELEILRSGSLPAIMIAGRPVVA